MASQSQRQRGCTECVSLLLGRSPPSTETFKENKKKQKTKDAYNALDGEVGKQEKHNVEHSWTPAYTSTTFNSFQSIQAMHRFMLINGQLTVLSVRRVKNKSWKRGSRWFARQILSSWGTIDAAVATASAESLMVLVVTKNGGKERRDKNEGPVKERHHRERESKQKRRSPDCRR